METSCQTDIEEIFGNRRGEILDVLENGRQESEKEISEEKQDETWLQRDYQSQGRRYSCSNRGERFLPEQIM